MADKNLKTRIVHKHDVESNWLKATNFAPKQGEIIVYDIDENYNYERIKIGDGTTFVSNLPFVDAGTLAGASLAKVLNSSDSEIPTSKAVFDALSEKSDAGHAHDDIYYTESEIDSKLSEINTSISNMTNGDTTVAKAEEATHATSADSADTASTASKAIADNDGNSIKDTYETKSDAASKLKEAKDYADTVKNDLLNGAGEAYDTLKELGDLINENVDAIDALETVASNKQDKIIGTAGQYVGFDANGNTVAQTLDKTYVVETNAGLEQKFWRGTKAEYDAIETKDDATMYIITDDNDSSSSDSGTVVASGDMKTSVYDPQGKSTDIFAYVDNAVSSYSGGDSVLYTQQTLTDAQKTQARTNIDAAQTSHVHSSEDVILTDTITGALYRLYVTDGKLTIVLDGEIPESAYTNGDEVTY